MTEQTKHAAHIWVASLFQGAGAGEGVVLVTDLCARTPHLYPLPLARREAKRGANSVWRGVLFVIPTEVEESLKSNSKKCLDFARHDMRI